MKTVLIIPIKTDNPWVGQPPLLRKKLKTSVAELCTGARYVTVISIAKNPTTWQIRMAPSIAGRKLLTTVLVKTAPIMQAYIISRACQLFGSYVSLFRMIKDWTIEPARRNADVAAPCQPHTVNQPMFSQK